jgi:hypothetical protein
MEEQNNEVKWIPISSLLAQVKHVEKRYNDDGIDYSIAVLEDGNKVIIDNRNARVLVSTIDKPYSVLGFETWIKKGFILVSFPREDSVNEYDDKDKYNEKYNDKEKYYILNAKDESIVGVGKAFDAYMFLEGKSDYFLLKNVQGEVAIFNKDGKQVSDWFDWIDTYDRRFGKADYYIVGKDGKEAICSKDGKQVTNWFDRIYYYIYYYDTHHVPPDYYRVEKDGKYAIFRKDGYQVSDWYDEIDLDGLLDGQSDYFRVKKDDEYGDKYAIFDKNGQQISNWYKFVYYYGLVKGESDYYLAEENGKRAIFHKSGKQISSWFDNISIEGLINGKSVFYVAKKNGKQAIFRRNGKQITDWFDYVSTSGLVEGKSDYYVAGKDDKRAIFYKDGQQLTGWLDGTIESYGVLEGKSDYYIVSISIVDSKKDIEIIYIGKLGSSNFLGPFNRFGSWDSLGFIRDPSSTSVKVRTLDGGILEIPKIEADRFFEGKELEDEQTR